MTRIQQTMNTDGEVSPTSRLVRVNSRRRNEGEYTGVSATDTPSEFAFIYVVIYSSSKLVREGIHPLNLDGK